MNSLSRTIGWGSALAVGGATLVLGSGVAMAAPGGTQGGNGANGDKVTICHATGSSTNPYVVITPDAAGVLNGHYAHQDQRDIIPPFTLRGQSYPGLNWSKGQEIYHNGCKVPDTPGTGGNPGTG